MRTLLIGALAATLVGCSCPLLPQASIEGCTDANGFACFDRMAASQPIEQKPASFKTESAPTEFKSTIAAKTQKPSSVRARDRAHLAMKTTESTAAADSDTTRAGIADSHPRGGAAANSNTRTIQEQVAASTAVAEQVTAAKPVLPAPEQKANNTDRSGRAETVLRGDAEKTAAASPNNTDHLVALLIARPEIKSVSDLTGKIVAIDDRHSASNDRVRTAIAAAGATEVQLSGGQTKAINRLISGEVPAAVLALVSVEAAEGFPEVAGFKIFRIPLRLVH
jgi:hypothetical protein